MSHIYLTLIKKTDEIPQGFQMLFELFSFALLLARGGFRAKKNTNNGSGCAINNK